MNDLQTISRHRAFGGWLGYYQHDSKTIGASMRFAVYAPPAAAAMPVPIVYCLAGLTCNEETFVVKANALRPAAALGLMLVAPDTSPRVRVPGDDASWDFGLGAGFYVDATSPPWSQHYRMESYVSRELPSVIEEHFPAEGRRQSIMGHSMGGHGALTIALRNPGRYRSVSAFAPIVAPTQVPWGQKAFAGYLGADRDAWLQYDATHLIQRQRAPGTIRIDQGSADKFLTEQLRPELFVAACKAAGQPLDYHLHEGYDHGYFFIQSFIEEHLRLHAAALAR
ncbi:MAG: S-formylglutathione hydrolase [Steroidobacteraceae bacterium]